MSSSQSSKANTRRCPQCRRRIKPFSMHCKNCNWKMPYRYLAQALIAMGIGLVVFGAYFGINRFGGSGGDASGISINRPKAKR